MSSFPLSSERMMWVLGFPATESLAVRRFAAQWCIGLGVMTKLVIENVFSENLRDPGLSKAWVYYDDRLGP
jgi:hypothetical protein